ncbi:hypothetical protein [Lacinutrix sp.]|uniref:hypothetical protein n=1 Tax=Lacinutrix sp. TaxID=1937692 RepID=UPI0025C39916|nr:hypothetical protein [Lacinutrix sp.]
MELIISRIDELSIIEKKNILKLNNSPRIILIANSFFHPTIRRAKKISNEISLFEYKYFSNKLFQLDEVKDNVKIKERLENILSSKEALTHSSKIIEIIKTVLSLNLIDERYYKIESGELIVNQTHLYKVYEKYYSNKELDFLSKSDFLKSIKQTSKHVRSIKAVWYKNNNTSGIVINLS